MFFSKISQFFSGFFNTSHSQNTLIKLTSIGLFTLIFFLGGIGFSAIKNKNPLFNTIAFITVGSSDMDSSIADKEVAPANFSETIIGWAHSPEFSDQLGFLVSSKKQERQNIVFEYQSSSEKKAQENFITLKSILNSKIKNYNRQFSTEYGLFFEPAHTQKQNPKIIMSGIGSAILGFFLGAIFAEILIGRRKKISQK